MTADICHDCDPASYFEVRVHRKGDPHDVSRWVAAAVGQEFG